MQNLTEYNSIYYLSVNEVENIVILEMKTVYIYVTEDFQILNSTILYTVASFVCTAIAKQDLFLSFASPPVPNERSLSSYLNLFL